MESIYFSELKENDSQIFISGSEARHLKALRIKINEQILISNGKGLIAKAVLESFNKDNFIFQSIDFFINLNESKFPIAMALGILSDRNRFEFALEKAVELGISDFFPLITNYVQKDKINEKRLLAKAITAMKQCKRSVLPKIHNPIEIDNLLRFTEFDTIILTNAKGAIPKNKNINGSVLIFVGPEGGFDDIEIARINQDERTLVWKLADRRLRAETAVISALSLI